MRVAVSAQGENLEAEIDPRFGRASRFLIIDTETMSHEVIDNKQELHLPQGAGIQAAQNVIGHKPDVVLTGNCGPKAFKVLQAGGVEVVVGVRGTVRNAIRDLLEKKIQPAREANVEGHWR